MASADQESISVEVVHARPDVQLVLSIQLAPGASVEEAIRASGILSRFPDIDIAQSKVGVFGKLVSLDSVLRDRDRVEIYRPLIADPKQARKTRAARSESAQADDQA